jgi:hypothetical protein
MTNHLSDKEKQQRIREYHLNELKLLLFIPMTNLDIYAEDTLIGFAEAMEGSIHLLRIESIANYFEKVEYDEELRNQIIRFTDQLVRILSSSWHTKMNSENIEWTEIGKVASDIAIRLEIQYNEPSKFIDDNFKVDWT